MFDLFEGADVRVQSRKGVLISGTHEFKVGIEEGELVLLSADKVDSLRDRSIANSDHVYLKLPKMTLGEMLNLWDNLPEDKENVRSFNTIFHHCILAKETNSGIVPLEGHKPVKILDRISSRVHMIEVDGIKMTHEFGDTSTLFNTSAFGR